MANKGFNSRKINKIIKVPKYYAGFSCVGGSCMYSCCVGWKISWSEEEIQKVKDAAVSDELRELVDNSFMADGAGRPKSIIKMTEAGKCPFLTEDMLCRIQKELGHEYLSDVCRGYPRKTLGYGNHIRRFCSLTCYTVLQDIFDNEDSMELENVPAKVTDDVGLLFTDGDVCRHPVLNYQSELFDFYYELLSRRDISIEDSVVLGALVAHKLSALAEKDESINIPEVLEKFRPQLDNPAQLEQIRNIKTNYNVKLGFLKDFVQRITPINVVNDICDHDIPVIGRYEFGMAKFNEVYKDKPWALRNVALDLYLEMRMPFSEIDMSIYDNYCNFAATFAAIKLVTAAAAFGGDTYEQVSQRLSLGIALICRKFTHNMGIAKEVQKLLNEYNCKSPAYLALLLK